MALITSVLSSAAGTSTLSCDLHYIPIKSEKDKIKQKGDCEDAPDVHPGCPSLIPPRCHRCWGCSTQGSRWDGVHPAPGSPRQGQGCPQSPSLHPRPLLTLCRFILTRAGGPLAALEAPVVGGQPEAKAAWKPCGCLGSVPPGGFLSLYGPHATAGRLLLSWIFHQSSRSLWALLYNDAESRKFQLLPESV